MWQSKEFSGINYKIDRLKSWSVDKSIPFEIRTYLYGIEKNAPAKIRIFNNLLQTANIYEGIWISQSRIAKKSGVTREYVNRVFTEFEHKGLLKKEYRPNKTCLYYLNPLFYDAEFRHSLGGMFTALRWIPKTLTFMLLISNFYKTLQCQDYQSRYITRSTNVEKINIYTPIPVSSKTMVYREQGQKKINLKRESLQLVNNRLTMKRFIQQEYPEAPVPPYIREITELKLTKWGQIKLCSFPEEAIKHGREKIKHFKNIRSPFNWFFIVCKEYCEANAIIPDWDWVRKLNEKYKVSPNASMLLSNDVIITQEIKRLYPVWNTPAPKVRHINTQEFQEFETVAQRDEQFLEAQRILAASGINIMGIIKTTAKTRQEKNE